MYSVNQIITDNRKRLKITQTELAERLAEEGVITTNKAISSWEKKVCEPSLAAFMAMCKIFGLTDIYEAYFGTNPGNQLSYLNEEGKAKAHEYIDLLRKSGNYDKVGIEIPSGHIRKLRLFRPKASAGTGSFLDNNEFDWIEVGDEVPQTADFGVMLSGDSMEPRFVNHQVVWVHQQCELQNSEIGIFEYNENAFCKQLRKDSDGIFLISLNNNYPPIKLGEFDEFKIFGKVVG